MDKSYDYLFVCSANIGRSQMAEGFYNFYAKGKNSISAAGLKDLRRKYSNKLPLIVCELMTEKEVDISENKIKMISEDLIAKSSKVVVFLRRIDCSFELKKKLSKHHHVRFIPVVDPISGDIVTYQKEDLIKRITTARDEIEKIILELINAK